MNPEFFGVVVPMVFCAAYFLREIARMIFPSANVIASDELRALKKGREQ